MRRSVCLCLVLAGLAAAQSPDREPMADEWGYRPAEGSATPVNPPALTWVHEKTAAGYEVQWADNANFERAAGSKDLPWTVYTHHAPLKPGTWFWRYRIVRSGGEPSPWSRTRTFRVPPDAVTFPQPAMDELRARIPMRHPRLFVRAQDLPGWREWARGGGSEAWKRLIARADKLVDAEPTPEPATLGLLSDPATKQYWWPNRIQTLRALQEVEVLSFAWLVTGERRYGSTARRFLMKLAAWNLDGPTNFKINCEAAKPMLHRLARGYDWLYDLLSEDDRRMLRANLLRRATDAWNSGEVRQGVGHLNQPYNSHGNRTWHKLAENALATFGETPESELFLRYAVTKFFAAYPAWSDDDGGWHEGLSYFAGYMSKAAWWVDVARVALDIDSFKKPFFAHFGDYALYTAPPGTPDLGFGDLAYRPPGPGWSFMHFFVRRTGNPHWAWWLETWKIPETPDEPVLDFLWSKTPPVAPVPPKDLPPSKVFRGTGIAVMNSTLLSALDNVQVRFKSSPMGRWSHGHDPHNSFTLNAYGEALLVNNVYRDLYGTPFHAKWVWSTRSQNAVLVNGEGQKPHSADLGGRIVSWDFGKNCDQVLGDATAAYQGRLKRALRRIVFLKPDVIVVADELEAPAPAEFQWMLHGQAAFQVDEPGQRLTLDRTAAGVVVDYVAERPLKMRQWTGYDPPPDEAYLKSVNAPMIPPQWHVETASAGPATRAFVLTVLRPYRKGQAPAGKPRIERRGDVLQLAVDGARRRGAQVTFRNSEVGPAAEIRD